MLLDIQNDRAHAPDYRSNGARIHEIGNQIIIKNMEVKGRVKRVQQPGTKTG